MDFAISNARLVQSCLNLLDSPRTCIWLYGIITNNKRTKKNVNDDDDENDDEITIIADDHYYQDEYNNNMKSSDNKLRTQWHWWCENKSKYTLNECMGRDRMGLALVYQTTHVLESKHY